MRGTAEKGEEPVALRDPGSDGSPPVVASHDIGLVEPDIVAALFQVGADTTNQFFVGVVALAEEDLEGTIHGTARTAAS